MTAGTADSPAPALVSRPMPPIPATAPAFPRPEGSRFTSAVLTPLLVLAPLRALSGSAAAEADGPDTSALTTAPRDIDSAVPADKIRPSALLRNLPEERDNANGSGTGTAGVTAARAASTAACSARNIASSAAAHSAYASRASRAHVARKKMPDSVYPASPAVERRLMSRSSAVELRVLSAAVLPPPPGSATRASHAAIPLPQSLLTAHSASL